MFFSGPLYDVLRGEVREFIKSSIENHQRGFIATILKNYFGFQDNSRLCAHTYCEVDYFRKDPEDVGSGRLKS